MSPLRDLTPSPTTRSSLLYYFWTSILCRATLNFFKAHLAMIYTNFEEEREPKPFFGQHFPKSVQIGSLESLPKKTVVQIFLKIRPLPLEKILDPADWNP